jgi:hypothetical protein
MKRPFDPVAWTGTPTVLLGADTLLLTRTALVLLPASTVRRSHRRYHAFRALPSSLRMA